MFLRKEIKEFNTGHIYLVPFCKDCDSQDIETIRICKKCGSHNVETPSIYENDDKRGHKKATEEREVYIYKCDKCGKEFNGKEVQSDITYDCGEFLVGKHEDIYCNSQIYTFKEDLCYDCLKKITIKLNKELDDINTMEHITKILKEI